MRKEEMGEKQMEVFVARFGDCRGLCVGVLFILRQNLGRFLEGALDVPGLFMLHVCHPNSPPYQPPSCYLRNEQGNFLALKIQMG